MRSQGLMGKTMTGGIYEIEFEIDGLPKMPNSLLGASWKVRAGHAKRWERLVWKCVWPIKPNEPLAHAALLLIRCSSMEADFDGLVGSFKCVTDGLVKCGIIIDDKPAVIGQPSYKWEKVPPGKGKIKVKVIEVREEKAI